MYSDKERIGRAFRSLKKLGYETSANRSCCGNCASSEMKTNKFVYYHRQDAAAFDEYGDIGAVNYMGNKSDKLYIGHGEDGDGWEVAKALTDQGLVISWDGTTLTRISVSHNDRLQYTHPDLA